MKTAKPKRIRIIKYECLTCGEELMLPNTTDIFDAVCYSCECDAALAAQRKAKRKKK